MKKVLSIVLTFALLLSFSSNLWVTAFAADEDITATVQGSYTMSDEKQDVTIRLELPNVSEAYCAFYIDTGIELPDGFEIKSFSTSNTAVQIAAADYNLSSGTLNYDPVSSTNSIPAGTYYDVVITVPANVSGDFTIKFKDVCATDSSYTNVIAEATEVSATLTIVDGSAAVTEAYTATLSSTTTTVDNDGTSTVSVDVVVGGTTKSFASTEIKLTYDPAYLSNPTGSSALTATVKEGQTDQVATFTSSDNSDGTKTLLIRDYGGNMTVDANGTTAYTVVFTTVKGGNTNVSLTSAGFSTQDNAASENLTYVTDTDSSVAVTINHKATVTVDGVAGTTAYVAPNGSYTYQISDYNATNYTYTVTATENGTTVDDTRITTSTTGLVTITGVTGELAVTISKTANSYTITWKDTEGAITTADKPTTQNYGTGITFAVKAGQAPNGTADGYYYSVKAYLTSDSTQTITVSGTPTDDNYVAKTYTIDANAITGNITIEVTKETVIATQTTITINDYSELSKDGTALTSGTLTVSKNTSVTLVLNKETGYDYTVQTKVGEADAQDVTVGTDGSFTITVGNDPVSLIITKTLNTSSVSVTEYVQLDGKTMWLVKIGSAQITDKTYTYTASEGATAENFFWSSKYSAYCYLVVTDTNTAADTVKADVAGKIGLTDATAVAINYNGNVNLTTNNGAAVIDVNDAQLVWNMYSAVYSDTSTVSVQKFLEADMDETVGLSTGDAAAVVAKIQ